MFSTIVQELKGYFGGSFLIASFFPGLLFVSLNLCVYLEITQGIGPALAAWAELSLQNQLVWIVGTLVVAMVLAYVSYNLQYSITRMFEGYWLQVPILRAIVELRRDYHAKNSLYLEQKAQKALKDKNPYSFLEYRYLRRITYPIGSFAKAVMPTQIGNILRVSEVYARQRYGIESVTMWTRLHTLLKPEAATALQEAQTGLNFNLLMTLLSAAFALFWCPVLIIVTDRVWLFLLCALGWPLAWIFYRNGVQSAYAFSEEIKATFDLYRLDLAKALHLEIEPGSEGTVKERDTWNILNQLLDYAAALPEKRKKPQEASSWDEVAEALTKLLRKIAASTPSGDD